MVYTIVDDQFTCEPSTLSLLFPKARATFLDPYTTPIAQSQKKKKKHREEINSLALRALILPIVSFFFLSLKGNRTYSKVFQRLQNGSISFLPVCRSGCIPLCHFNSLHIFALKKNPPSTGHFPHFHVRTPYHFCTSINQTHGKTTMGLTIHKKVFRTSLTATNLKFAPL